MKKLIKSIFLFLITLTILTIAWFGFKGYERYAQAIEKRPFEEVVSEIESRENYVSYAELPDMYVKAVISIEDKRFETHPGFDVIGITRALFTDVTTMSFKEGGSTITEQLMKNLYFDQEKQKWLDKGLSDQEAYDKAKTVVAVPGYSEHNSGLAADIVTPDHQTLDSAFADTDAAKWLFEHAPDYGFILRYPEDKQAITGIIYEPWHYRYVGVENAKTITESGKCLEEYLDGLSA